MLGFNVTLTTVSAITEPKPYRYIAAIPDKISFKAKHTTEERKKNRSGLAVALSNLVKRNEVDMPKGLWGIVYLQL